MLWEAYFGGQQHVLGEYYLVILKIAIFSAIVALLPFLLACFLSGFLHPTCVDKVRAVLVVLWKSAK